MKICQQIISLCLALAMLCSFFSVMAVDTRAVEIEETTAVETIPAETIAVEVMTEATLPAETETPETLPEETVFFVNIEESKEVFAEEEDSAVTSGICGENLTWLFENGILTISGTGKMTNYTEYCDMPWYDYLSEIESIVVEEGVDSLGNYAFYQCRAATEVSLSKSLTSIGEHSFECCEALTSVRIPEGIAEIPAYAFAHCVSLASVPFPSTLKSIGDYAFYDCEALEGVVFPENLTTIGESAFYSCDNISRLVFDNVEVIGAGAFSGCDSLNYITLSTNVKKIGDSIVSYLSDVYFDGTEAQWNEIEFIGDNSSLLDANIHFNNGYFTDGVGSPEDPYQISNAAQLDAVRHDMTTNTYYLQVADIDLNGVEWEPIGAYIGDGISAYPEDFSSFYGIYNGNGYKISNMNVSRVSDEHGAIGLFGYNSGILNNITLDNTDISVTVTPTKLFSVSIGGDYYPYPCIGSVAGHSTGSIIDCRNYGNISVTVACSGQLTYVGGVVGVGTCSNCVNNSTINVELSIEDSWTNVFCGGIVGYPGAITTEIEHCVNYGNVSVSEIKHDFSGSVNEIAVGGISGEDGSLQNCVNFGNISASKVCRECSCAAGGIVGETDLYWHEQEGLFWNCYNLGKNIHATKSFYVVEPDELVDSQVYVGAIFGTGDSNTYYTDSLPECYTINTVNLTDTTPDDIADDVDIYGHNGTPLSAKEINLKIKDILLSLGLPWDENVNDEGEDDPDQTESRTVLRYYSSWDDSNNVANFGAGTYYSCQVTESTDSSFRSNPTRYLNQYVLVEAKPGEDKNSLDVLISMKPVETRTGTVTSADASSIVIDGNSYTPSEGLENPEGYVNQDVVYHLYEEKLVGIEILQFKEGILTSWDKENSTLNIKQNADDELANLYYLSPQADESTMAFLGETGSRKDKVQFSQDSNHVVFMVARARFNPETDAWNFTNSNDYFGTNQEGYYITNFDYNQLISDLSETDKILISENLKLIEGTDKLQFVNWLYNIDGSMPALSVHPWGGSCYGMSSWAVLTHNGILEASVIDGETESLHDYYIDSSYNSATESAINYYHYQQNLADNKIKVNDFMSRSQSEQIDILEQLGKEANETGEVFLVRYQWYEDTIADGITCDTDSGAGHAVVGYGWEKLEEPREYQEKEYQYRILIYDCADPSGDRHLYYNNNSDLYISGWNVASTDSQTMDTIYNNGQLKLATKDPTLVNGVDFRTGEANSDKSIPSLFVSSDSSYTLQVDETTVEIEGFSVNSTNEDHGIHVVLDANITADGDTTQGTATVLLPDSENYCISSEEDDMAFRFHNGNYLTDVALASPGSIIFQDDGMAAFESADPTTYYVDLVANDGYHDLPWYRIEITGSDTAEVSTEKTDDGIIIHSDNLTDTSITVTDKDSEQQITISTQQDSIMIAEEDDELTIYADSDGDGIYEQNITENGHIHNYDVDVIAPTCTEGGYTTYTCECGDSYVADEVEPTGHSWDEGTVTKEPTAEESGVITYECTVCEETREEVIPALSAVQRIAGADRIETALAVATELKAVLGVEKFDSIILAAGGSGSDQTKFADALSGSYLASAKKAPILLYTTGNLSSKNLTFIEENLRDNGTIYLLGGNVSIPAEVEDSLNASGYTTKRLGGADRYQTNLIILEEAGIDSADEILIAGGQAFADSLSASATGLPIMLVNGTKTTLTTAQIEFLQSLTGKKVTILGGTAAVSADLESAIEEAVGGTADRIYGDARENTSAMIAEKYFADADMALIAYSRMYPDGLAGGVLANALHAPLLLTKAGSESIANAYIEEYGIEAGYALGGTAVMTDETVRAVFGLAEDAVISQK